MMKKSSHQTSAAFNSCVIHWFRRDLRLADNAALNAAVSASAKQGTPLVPLYVIDPSVHGSSVCGRVRLHFILESLNALRESLASHGMQLRIERGDAQKRVPEFARDVGASSVFFERELNEAALKRDKAVQEGLNEIGVNVKSFHGFTLYDPDWLLKQADGEAPKGMKGFLTLIEKIGPPSRPEAFDEETAKSLPVVGQGKQDRDDGSEQENDSVEDKTKIQESEKRKQMKGNEVPTIDDLRKSNEDEDIPAGVHGGEKLKGGEKAALDRLHAFTKRDGGRAVRDFSKPETSPAAVDPRATTALSAYVAIGALSSRTFFHSVVDAGGDGDGGQGGIQTTLRGQLLWREHFWSLAYSIPNFERMQGNPLCRKIDWRDDKEALERWRKGRTGFPWIDALMTQLRVDGFVHHLGRHSVACFLTRGDLWISWEEGAKAFQQLLIDHDHALNAANWMWLSCSAFFNRYFRVYSPVTFANKWDSDGEFIRRYIPALRRMPKKYIHEPWLAPLAVQKKAGCIIGKDYPKPMVDHKQVSKHNVQKMKEAFSRGHYGSPSSSPPPNLMVTECSSDDTGKEPASKKAKTQ